MKKFINFLKKHSKKLAVISVVSVAALGVGVASSWGPDRRTFTVENPADYITFNSITNNPNIGDEREFVSIKDAANTSDGGWRDSVTVEPGKEYLVRIYAHNNAASSLNLNALNTRVKANVPTNTAKTMQISGFVSADNAQPREVWDDIRLSSDRDFNLAYVSGSARIYNNGYAAGGNGQPLPDSIVTSAGAAIGYNGADGRVPGCFEYANYIYFKVKPQFAQQPDYSIEKEVRKKGTQNWGKNTKVNPGDEVEWRMQFRNTGETQLNNVAIVDETPKNTTTVPGSVELFDSNHPSGHKFGSEAIQGKLINLMIGNYGAKSNAWIYYNSKIDSKDKLECGVNKLVNKVYVTPKDLPTIEDDATVEVEKECQEEPKFSCDALEADRLDIKLGQTVNFTARGSASGGAEITGYIFRVNGQVAQESASNRFAYTATTAGTHDVSVIVKTNRGNTAETAACKKQLKVTKDEEPEKPKYECKALEAVRIGKNKYRFTTTVRAEGAEVNKYIYNFGDNSEEFNTTDATVEHTYPGPGEYTATVRVIFDVDGEQKEVGGDNCKVTINIPEEPCPIPGKEDLPKDHPDCKEKPPVIPEEPGEPGQPPVSYLPETGMAGVLAGIFGTSATAYGAYAWIESRRTLRNMK